MKDASGIPILRTARLVLRGHRQDDFEACSAMWADPLVTRYIGGKPSSAQQTWLRLLSYVGLWAWLGFGYWAIESKATGQFIGELGFADFKRDLVPACGDTPELGWALVSEAHGQGFATEAVGAVIAWGNARLPTTRISCLIDPANVASLRIAEKFHFHELQRASCNGRPAVLFCRDTVEQE